MVIWTKQENHDAGHTKRYTSTAMRDLDLEHLRTNHPYSWHTTQLDL